MPRTRVANRLRSPYQKVSRLLSVALKWKPNHSRTLSLAKGALPFVGTVQATSGGINCATPDSLTGTVGISQRGDADSGAISPECTVEASACCSLLRSSSSARTRFFVDCLTTLRSKNSRNLSASKCSWPLAVALISRRSPESEMKCLPPSFTKNITRR